MTERQRAACVLSNKGFTLSFIGELFGVTREAAAQLIKRGKRSEARERKNNDPATDVRLQSGSEAGSSRP